jgi:hypothetical protein
MQPAHERAPQPPDPLKLCPNIIAQSRRPRIGDRDETAHLSPQQSLNFFQDFVDRDLRDYADAIRVSLAPIEALHLIAENGTLNRETMRQHHFERIAFNLGRDRTEYR